MWWLATLFANRLLGQCLSSVLLIGTRLLTLLEGAIGLAGMGDAFGFESLEVWKRSCALAVRVYQVLSSKSDFGLVNQMQRAAVSIPSNIAEGYERSPKDFIRMLRIASGSAAELRTQAYIACRIGLIDAGEMREITSETKEIAKMVAGLIRAKQRPASEILP